jgi:hypothetical protein
VFAAPPPIEDTLLDNGGLFLLWSVLRLSAPRQDGELLKMSILEIDQQHNDPRYRIYLYPGYR